MQRLRQTLGSGMLAVSVVLCASGAIRADEPLAQYFEGLRNLRMFTVAETEAQRRLAQEGLPAAQRVDLTIELSRTWAAHAMFSTGEERQELWTQAELVVSDLLRENPTSAFRGLLHVQRAMVPAARGAQLRWQSELYPLDQATRTDAAAILREAIDRLVLLPEALHADLQHAQATHRSGADSAEQPAPHRLYRLLREVEFAIATAQLDLAKVLSQGADGVAALLAADEHFEALTRSARPDAIAWQSRVQRLDILRLRGEYERLSGQVTSLLKSDPPGSVADAALAVLVRRWLDEDRPDEALASLEEYRREHGLAAQELQALTVESLLEARRLALEKAEAALASELLSQAQDVDAQLHGAWKARTSLLLQQADEDNRYGTELAASVREAHWAWQNGEADKAIAAFTRAAATAHQQGDADLAVEFGLNIASAQMEVGQLAAAVRSLENLLAAYPDHEQAPQADLLRVYVLGRIFEQQISDEHLQAYRQALMEHRQAFADAPTHAEATWMLARLLDFEQDADGAITLLRAIPAESEHYPAAIVRLAAIFDRMIDQARRQDRPTSEWERRAVETLTPIVESFPPGPAVLTIEQADVVRRLGRMLLYRSPPDFARAESLLQRVIDGGEPAIADAAEDPTRASQVASASQLQIISLAGQGRLNDARNLLDTLAADAPQRMLEILNGLTDVAAEIGLEHRSGIARMQLELAESLKDRPSSLPEDQQRMLDLSLAQANAAIGQWQTAARIYEEMLWKQPKDRDVVAALARLYEDCGSAGCLRQAIKQWQTLEALQRKGSIEWLKSRYHLARCSHELGDDETARKLIGVTRVLYPQLGTPTLQAEFEALAARIEWTQK